MKPAAPTDADHDARLSDLNLLPRRVYRLRMLGMALAALPLAAVLREIEAPPSSWALLLFTSLVWPQLAMFLARRSHDPYRTELRSLMVDSALAGVWTSLMHFNLLPATLLITLATVDKISTGIRGLWLWSLPGLLAGLLGGALLTGFAFAPATSLTVLLASLPMLLIHTITVSLVSYRLVRKVQLQNRQLDELSRIDVLTGLESRRTWQNHSQQLLRARHAGGAVVSLMLIDVDHFKDINDRHGHATGDDVLRAIAAILRRAALPGDHAGRYGGDEFALTLIASAAEAERRGERIRGEVESLRFPHLPALRCSVSIGLAEASDDDIGLREWIESADASLYRAKAAGRNRVAGGVLRRAEALGG